MNIKNYITKHKFCLIIITILIIAIIFLLAFKKTTYLNPYEVKYDSFDNFLFLGDSITDFYPLDEYYDEIPVVNSGISGNKTTDILNDMEKRVYQYNPSKVFILIGTNDLDSPDKDIVKKTYNNIKKIISNIRKNRSKAKIYLESVYPVNNKVINNSVNNRDNKKIKQLNKLLKEYAKEEDVIYIDIYKSLKDQDGFLNSKYTDDGLHLNSLGYVVVTRELLPYLSK